MATTRTARLLRGVYGIAGRETSQARGEQAANRGAHRRARDRDGERHLRGLPKTMTGHEHALRTFAHKKGHAQRDDALQAVLVRVPARCRSGPDLDQDLHVRNHRGGRRGRVSHEVCTVEWHSRWR